MFLSTNGTAFTDGHADISFSGSKTWGDDRMGEGTQTLNFTLGAPARGPLVMLAAMDAKPGDEEKFPPIIHMHRSDSFRTILAGDFYIGPKIYSDGEAMFQRSGTFYGPEQPGPEAIRTSSTVWALLVFGDRRGHCGHAKGSKYTEMIAAMNAAAAPRYAEIGVTELIPEDSKGVADIRSTVDLEYRGGNADLTFTDAGAWPSVAGVKLFIASFGNVECGPLAVAISAPPGGQAAPAATWKTEVMLVVVHGSCAIGGTEYLPGDLRVQEAGVPMPATIAGAGGADVYLVVADRRAADPRIDEDAAAASAWAAAVRSVAAEFSRPRETASAH